MPKKPQRPPVKKQAKRGTPTNTPNIKKYLPAAIAIGAVVLMFCVQYVWFPEGLPVAVSANAVVEIQPVGPIRINEVMSSNNSAFTDDRGNYPDWIELTNTSNAPVDITGWAITDDMKKELRFTFPNMTLGPGEFTVVFASNDLRAVPGYAFHAPFKLSASGDSVLLFDAGGSIMESVNVPALGRNQVYMRDPDTGEWGISGYYTPGMANVQENHYALTNTAGVESSPLVLSEVMADNASYAPDEDGEYVDFIELYNSGNSAILLAGYGLSDDEAKPGAWRFPDVTIGPGEYLIVYASGKDRRDPSGELHTGFKLNAEGETLILTNASGQVIDRMSFDNLGADRSLSKTGGGQWTGDLAPTPGLPNTRDSASRIDAQFMSANAQRLYINEAMASARQAEATASADDWLELYNASDTAIDLTGYGLSDDASRPRKWQFPSGSRIQAGQYLKVALTGLNTGNVEKMQLHTNFKLGLSKNEVLTLCTPDGTIIDRMPMLNQRAAIAYGRVPGGSGFFYLEKATPGAPNDANAFTGWTQNVAFSQKGGLYDAGPVTVELSAQPGATIRYTLDCTEPDQTSPVYTGPITLSETTIVRARAFSEGEIPSFVGTQSYFLGVRHTMPVISLVSAPDNLYSDERGIMVKGPNALRESPYGSLNNGANFWMEWERAANIEMFGTDGETILSQGVGIAMQGAYSRAERQKAFFVTARNVYGDNRLRAELFPNRDYTEYKSFVLRGSGQDGNKTRMRDSLLVTLAEGTGVMYQDTRLAVVYINGEYYGHYNMRERNHKYAVAQFMGWTDLDAIDLVKANTNVKKGSNETFATMLEWLKKNGCKTEENLRRVAEVVDIDNYLNYIAVEMYVGNTDTLNVKRYRSSTEGDGKWRWILFDLDWAMVTDTNSFSRWLNPKGMGNGMRTDNTLFVELMKNSTIREQFLTLLGELMATNFDRDVLIAKIDQRYQELLPEMPMHQERFSYTMKQWEDEIREFKKYAQERPKKLLTYIKQETGMSTEQMRKYFGAAMEKIGL